MHKSWQREAAQKCSLEGLQGISSLPQRKRPCRSGKGLATLLQEHLRSEVAVAFVICIRVLRPPRGVVAIFVDYFPPSEANVWLGKLNLLPGHVSPEERDN